MGDLGRRHIAYLKFGLDNQGYYTASLITNNHKNIFNSNTKNLKMGLEFLESTIRQIYELNQENQTPFKKLIISY